MIAQGFNSTDAKRLGFEQQDVKVDHGDGRGSVVAQADFLAGLVEVLVGGRLRRRISSAFDQEGQEYWVRQLADLARSCCEGQEASRATLIHLPLDPHRHSTMHHSTARTRLVWGADVLHRT